MRTRKRNLVVSAALVGLVAIAVLALAGVSIAGNGHGHGHGYGHSNNHGHANSHGNGNGDDQGEGQSASSAEYQYGSAGNQYGGHRVSLCHKGHTIAVAQPAVRAHLRHGDKLGAC